MKRVLIIEDEPRAVQRLKRLLGSLRPEWEVIATADTVVGAIEIMQAHSDADLIFSDIQLADGLSFEALEQVQPKTPIIFVTAYDQYAIKAFDHWSVDYLLKPSSEGDLAKALEKWERVSAPSAPSQSLDLKALMQEIAGQQASYKQRYVVKVGDKLRFFDINEILAFHSEDRVSYLLTKEGRSYPLDNSLDEIAKSVDPSLYFRINRKFVVSAESLLEITSWSNSRLRLVIKGMESQMVVVARERTTEFKQWLDQ